MDFPKALLSVEKSPETQNWYQSLVGKVKSSDQDTLKNSQKEADKERPSIKNHNFNENTWESGIRFFSLFH